MARTLHVPDCPMTNSDEDARTSCVCEEWEAPRDTYEGLGGWRPLSYDRLLNMTTGEWAILEPIAGPILVDTLDRIEGRRG